MFLVKKRNLDGGLTSNKSQKLPKTHILPAFQNGRLALFEIHAGREQVSL